MVQKAYCPQCGYLLTSHTGGDFCANCHWPAATWATDKISALEAERDELKLANEDMAAMIGAGKESVKYVLDNSDPVMEQDWLRHHLSGILDGPVPECRACAEAGGLLHDVRQMLVGARGVAFDDMGFHENAGRGGLVDARQRQVADMGSMLARIEKHLARHAAEGGDHE